MRKSKKIFLIFASCPLGLALLFLFALRLTLGTSMPERPAASETAYITRAFNLEGFTGIDVRGHWDVEAVHGETPKVIIEAPGDVMDGLTVEKHAGTLILDKGRLGRHRELRASLATPFLTDLGLKGLVRLRLRGFETERLSIRAEGAVTITGNNNCIGELHLAGEGMNEINLKGNPVTHADLQYEGMYTIRLTMAGGTLRGNIEGMGKVIYDGHVKEERIRSRGRSEVRHE